MDKPSAPPLPPLKSEIPSKPPQIPKSPPLVAHLPPPLKSPPSQKSSAKPPPILPQQPQQPQNGDMYTLLEDLEERSGEKLSWEDYEDYFNDPRFTCESLCVPKDPGFGLRWVDQNCFGPPPGSGMRERLILKRKMERKVPEEILANREEYFPSVVKICKFFAGPFHVVSSSYDVLSSHSEIAKQLKTASSSKRNTVSVRRATIASTSPPSTLMTPPSSLPNPDPSPRKKSSISASSSNPSFPVSPRAEAKDGEEGGLEFDDILLGNNVFEKSVPKSRKGFTLLIPPSDDPKPALYSYEPFEPSSQPKKLLMHCRNMVIDLGSSFEPYYCCVSLHQLHGEGKRTSRLSAPFYFNCNSSTLMNSILGEQYSQIDPIQHIRKAIFSVPDPNPDIILILKIAKGMRAVEADKIYFKPSMAKAKEVEKLKKETKDLLPHEFMGPFAWAFCFPFDEEGSGGAGDLVLTELRPLRTPLTDEMIFEALEKEDKKEKTKFIRGQVDLSFSLVDELSVPSLYTPSFNLIGEKLSSPKEAVRQIQDVGTLTYPHRYVNSLYLYPESVQLKHSSNLMMEFQLKLTDRGDPIKAFTTPNSTTPTSSTFSTWVTHKEKKDQFCDEIELHLPPSIAPPSSSSASSFPHLLLTLYTVNLSQKKKEDKKVVFGYIVIPLFPNPPSPTLPDGRFSFPILSAPLPPNYLSVLNDSALYHEGKKPLFTLKMKLVSSIFTSDFHMAECMMAIQNEEKVTKGGDISQAKRSLYLSLEEHLTLVDPLVSYQFLPLLLDTLFTSLLGAPEMIPEQRRGVLLLVVGLLQRIRKYVFGGDLNSFLRSYVWFWFTYQNRPEGVVEGGVAPSPSPRKRKKGKGWGGVGEEVGMDEGGSQLYMNLVVAYEGVLGGDEVGCSGSEAWFLLDMILKSIIIHLYSRGALKRGLKGEERKELFRGEFVGCLEKIMNNLLSLNKLSRGNYTEWLATRWLTNLLQVGDRGWLFTWMRDYFKKMEPDDQHSVKVKFSILKGMVDDINFLPLALPVNNPIRSISGFQEKHWKLHYMAGQILNEVSNCLTDFNSPDVNFCRKHAADSFNLMLQKLESKSKNPRVAELFFPYLALVSKNVLVIEPFTSSLSYDYFFAFVRLLSITAEERLLSWWKAETQRGLTLFCKALSVSLKVLVENTHTRCRQMSVISSSSAMTMKDLKLLRHKGNETGEGDHIIHDTFITISRTISKFLEYLQVGEKGEERTGGGGEGHLVGAIFGVIHDLGSMSDIFLEKCGYFLLLRNFVMKFGPLMFKYQNNVCLNMAHDVLKHCSHKDPSFRSKACALFYLLLDQNFKIAGDYERMAVVSSVALSELLGKNVISDSRLLSLSLSGVREYALEKLKKQGGNDQQEDALKRILSKISDLLQYNQTISEVSSIDPELTTDLYEKISNSYFEAPDTRVQWVENMASFHISHKNYVEAALCKIHHAELVREYLHKYSSSSQDKSLPISTSHFALISPNVGNEPPLFPQFAEKGEGGEGERGEGEEDVSAKFQLASWSVGGLVKLLEEAIGWLKEATCYESALEVYSILEIIFKYTKNYSELVKILDGYRECVSTLLQDPARLTPKYFRVSYFGKKCGDLHGKGFIYRVGGGTSLHAFTAQIKGTFKGQVKNENDFVILPNKPVEEEGLDPEKVYLQIGGITVHHSDASTTSEFILNHHCHQFLFEMSHQKTQKKKLIYTVERHFPYVKTRLEIVKMDELILSPIEAAIENVNDRVKAIRSELSAASPRINTLQQILQGSVVPMVNEGPLKICADFLAPEVVDQFDPVAVATLRDVLREFIRNCGFALRLNARLIDEKHKPFQDMCQQKYEELSKLIKQYLD